MFFLDNLKLEPGVVGNLVCEKCDEEGLEDGVGEGFIVCALVMLLVFCWYLGNTEW